MPGRELGLRPDKPTAEQVQRSTSPRPQTVRCGSAHLSALTSHPRDVETMPGWAKALGRVAEPKHQAVNPLTRSPTSTAQAIVKAPKVAAQSATTSRLHSRNDECKGALALVLRTSPLGQRSRHWSVPVSKEARRSCQPRASFVHRASQVSDSHLHMGIGDRTVRNVRTCQSRRGIDAALSTS